MVEDINDPKAMLEEAYEIHRMLKEGLLALSLDFDFYMGISVERQNLIYRLREDIGFRYHSSIFHLELLVRHIEHITELLDIKDIDKYPDFYFVKEVFPTISLFDSILYHLSSQFDYISSLINLICAENNREQKFDWTKMRKSIRATDNKLSKRRIANIFIQVDQQLLQKLYSHRSQSIHESSDGAAMIYKITSIGGVKSEAKYLCSKKTVKRYKGLIDKENDYTVIYLAFFLIKKSGGMTAKILFALKQEIEAYPDFLKEKNKPSAEPLFYTLDSNTDEKKSPSEMHWKSFIKYFKNEIQ